MARPSRQEHPGAVHHVFARRVEGLVLFGDDEERSRYLDLVGRMVRHRKWRCLAYCLMDTHVHLLVETPGADLGRGMQWLHGMYARAYNDRRARRGHVFASRYGSVPITDDEQLLTATRYIALNPVKAGLVARPDAYAWSSHAATLGGGSGPAWLARRRLLGFFGDREAGLRRYAAFVNDGVMLLGLTR